MNISLTEKWTNFNDIKVYLIDYIIDVSTFNTDAYGRKFIIIDELSLCETFSTDKGDGSCLRKEYSKTIPNYISNGYVIIVRTNTPGYILPVILENNLPYVTIYQKYLVDDGEFLLNESSLNVLISIDDIMNDITLVRVFDSMDKYCRSCDEDNYRHKMICHRMAESKIEELEQKLNTIGSLSDSEMMLLTVLRREVVILNALENTSLDSIGVKLDEYKKHMSNTSLYLIDRDEYKEMCNAKDKLKQLRALL